MILLIVKIALFFLFLACVGFFSGIETALTSLTTATLRRAREQHPDQEPFLAFWETRPNEVLATILVGTNLVLVGTSVLATSVALDVAALFDISQNFALIGVPAVAVTGTLIFGEIVPKIVSRYRAEQVSLFGLPYIVKLNSLLGPVNTFLIRFSEAILSVFGREKLKESPFIRTEELRLLLSSEDTLPLSGPARRLMCNILDFGKLKIRQVMKPRAEMQSVNLDQEPKKVIEQIIEKEYSRVPVYRGSLDNIVGIIYSRDLALAWRGGALFLIDDLIRPVHFIHGSARVDQVLREFKTSHHHMALVVDEFGATIGLVTIEDLVEEIVGEIWDEYDIQVKTILPLPDGGWLVRAGESLSKVNDELKLDLPANDFATVSGWVLDLFGRIPRIGDTVAWGTLVVEIADADKKKVLRVKIKKAL